MAELKFDAMECDSFLRRATNFARPYVIRERLSETQQDSVCFFFCDMQQNLRPYCDWQYGDTVFASFFAKCNKT
jgi:hypothetical protein